jgi:putative copper export protein
MPNWWYILVNSAYLLALSVWIGGVVALGALAAPVLFRALPRPDAGAIFGPILRRFSRVRLVCVVVMILAAMCKYLVWETHVVSPWIAIRWLALASMAAIVLYELFGLEPAMERSRGTPEFGRLHKRSELLMKLGLGAAVVALLLS